MGGLCSSQYTALDLAEAQLTQPRGSSLTTVVPFNSVEQPLNKSSSDMKAPSKPLKIVCSCAVFCGLVVGFIAAGPFIWCYTLKEPMVPTVSNGLALIDRHWGGRPTFNYWNLPAQPSAELTEECNRALKNPVEFLAGRWGEVNASEAPALMYKCTKVPGVFEHVPQEFRGVFWMRGNGLPEELAVMQNGAWYPDERTFVWPQAPFMWSWAAGKPNDAPFDGAAYTEFLHKTLAVILPMLLAGFSIKFDDCPSRWDLGWLKFAGHACPTGPTPGVDPDLTYASSLQAHLFGNMSFHVTDGAYTLEYNDSSEVPGAEWYRGIYERTGQCACEYGTKYSYELTKIIDANGQPIQPYFSQWVEYMGDVPLLLWGGITDSELKALLDSDQYSAAVTRLKEIVCDALPADPFNFCNGQEPDLSKANDDDDFRF